MNTNEIARAIKAAALLACGVAAIAIGSPAIGITLVVLGAIDCMA